MSQYGTINPSPSHKNPDGSVTTPAVHKHTVTYRDGSVVTYDTYRDAIRAVSDTVSDEGYRPTIMPVYPDA